ncbi:MAG: TonB-dependent receptor [Thermoanaerobaculia bacterium]
MLEALALLGIVGGSISNPSSSTTTAPHIEETVVVTGSLVEEPGDDLPVSTTVIERTEIAERQATQVADLLRTVPGLEVVRSGSPGKTTSVFGRGANSNQTLVLWNGLELNDPYFGGYDWAFLPTDGVDRIEVVRGPASTLYGSDAIGGVVQVVSAETDGLALSLEGGSNDYERAGLAAGRAFGSARLDVAGSLRRGEGEIANDSYDGDELAAHLDWAPSEALSVGILARAADSDVGIPYDFFGQPSPHRLQEREARQLAVPVSWRGEGGWRLDGRVSRATLDLGLSDPDDPFAASRSESEALRGRVVAARHFGQEAASWIGFGGDWERQQASSASAFGPGLENETQRTWAGFGELHVDRGPWTLDLGARRDDNDAFGEHLTGRAGLVRRLGAGLRVHAAWAQGFRAPSLGDLYFPGFGNPDLEPETSESVETGVRWDGESRDGAAWGLGVIAFHSDIDDLIVFDPLTNVPQNIGRARSRGVELSGSLSGGSLWSRLAVTWLDAEDLDTGEPLVRRPEWSGSLVAGWHRKRWSVTGTFRGVGDRTDLGSVPLDAYSVVDLAARISVSPRFAPYARVENLFDEQYEEAAGFPAPGVGVIGGLAIGLGGAP